MEKWLRDVDSYLRQYVPMAYEEPPLASADELDAASIGDRVRFWDSNNGQDPDLDLDELDGPLSDALPLGHQQIRESVQQKGVDALAWYQPFHSYGRRWGIYLLANGIAYVAHEIMLAHRAGSTTFRRRDAVRAAIEALLRHEESHFEVEVYASGLEVNLCRPVYLPYRRYFGRTGDFCREESLANRRMVDHGWAKKPHLGGHVTKDAIEALADMGPRDYSLWREYVAGTSFDIAKNSLGAEIVEARYVGIDSDPPGSGSRLHSGPLLPRCAFYPGHQLSTPFWDRCHIPVYVTGVIPGSVWSHVFFTNLTWRQLREWGAKSLPSWYFPAVPGPHGGVDSKVWTGGRPGVGHGIPVKVYGGTKAVSVATLRDIADQAGIRVVDIGRATAGHRAKR